MKFAVGDGLRGKREESDRVDREGEGIGSFLSHRAGTRDNGVRHFVHETHPSHTLPLHIARVACNKHAMIYAAPPTTKLMCRTSHVCVLTDFSYSCEDHFLESDTVMHAWEGLVAILATPGLTDGILCVCDLHLLFCLSVAMRAATRGGT